VIRGQIARDDIEDALDRCILRPLQEAGVRRREKSMMRCGSPLRTPLAVLVIFAIAVWLPDGVPLLVVRRSGGVVSRGGYTILARTQAQSLLLRSSACRSRRKRNWSKPARVAQPLGRRLAGPCRGHRAILSDEPAHLTLGAQR
jgi:hypothetical protein